MTADDKVVDTNNAAVAAVSIFIGVNTVQIDSMLGRDWRWQIQSREHLKSVAVAPIRD